MTLTDTEVRGARVDSRRETLRQLMQILAEVRATYINDYGREENAANIPAQMMLAEGFHNADFNRQQIVRDLANGMAACESYGYGMPERPAAVRRTRLERARLVAAIRVSQATLGLADALSNISDRAMHWGERPDQHKVAR